MSWLRRLTSRRQSLGDLSEEIAAHLEERAAEFVAAGMPIDEARARARREFGNPTAIEERARDVWRWPLIETFWGDLRRAVRMLRKAPAFSLVAVLTLALGIGANAAIFSVVNAVLLRPLPFPGPEQLVRVFSVKDGHVTGPSPLDVRDFGRESHSFEHLVVYDTWRKNLGTSLGEPEQIRVGLVPADYFHALGIRPLAGRFFSEDENRWGAHHVAVVSSSFWAEHFGKQQALTGQSIRINDEPYAVIGVVPDVIPAWMDPVDERVRVWTPFAPSPDVWDESGRGDRGGRGFSTIGRLKPGVSIHQASAELEVIARDLGERYPVDRGLGVTVEPLLNSRVASLRPTLTLLTGAVALILLLACFNVASLLVARNGTRQQEFAIRTALGAGRARLASQLLSETLVLSSLGAIAGLGLARLGTGVLAIIRPDRIPQLAEARIDGRVLLFTFSATLATTLLFGIAPALLSAPANPADVLKAGGGRGGTAGRGQRSIRRLLATVEVALSLVLLVGAGLLVNGLIRLQARDLGFRRDHLLTEHLFLPDARYGSPDRITRFCEDYVARIRELPGVSAATVTDIVPPSYRWKLLFSISGRPAPSIEAAPAANFGVTDTEYLRTLGIRLLRGRDFAEADRAGAPRVVLVNETFARRFFPDEDPVGRQLDLGEPAAPNRPALTIIGVIADVKNRGVPLEPDPDIVGLFRQNPEENYGFKSVVVRTTVPPGLMAPELRRTLRALDPELPFAEVRTMDEILAREATEGRFATWLFGAFAILGLALAAVGVYGLVAYLVTLRRKEIAIRFALGARAMDVVRLITGEGMTVGLIGMAVGLVGALAGARLASSFLYGLSPRDPLTFAASAAALALVLSMASVFPCLRAVRIEAHAALLVEGE